MTRGLGGHAPANVTQHLKGAHFPTDKRHLIDLAKKNGAEGDVLEVLETLPGSDYASIADVMKAYGDAAAEQRPSKPSRH